MRKKSVGIKNKIKCYFLILNLIVSIIAFSGLTIAQTAGGSSAQTAGGIYTYEGSPVVYKNLVDCNAAALKATAPGAQPKSCIKVEMKNIDITKEQMEKSLLENQDSMTNDQKKEFGEKILEKEGIGKIKIEGGLDQYKIMKTSDGKYYAEYTKDGKTYNYPFKEIKEGTADKKKFGVTVAKNIKIKRITFGKDGLIKSDYDYQERGLLGFSDAQGSKAFSIITGKEIPLEEFNRLTGGTGGFTSSTGNIGSVSNNKFNILGSFIPIAVIATIAVVIAMSINGDKEVTSENGKVKTTLENNASVRIVGKDGQQIAVGQNDPSKTTTIISESENKHTVTNANIIVPNQIAAETPSQETTIVLQGTPGNDPNNPALTDSSRQPSLPGTPRAPVITASILPLLKTIQINALSVLTGTITGKAVDTVSEEIGGQSIKLVGHDLEINGNNIKVYALKDFNKLIVGGRNIEFYSGEDKIVFDNQRIYISRTFHKAPYGVKVIKNKLADNEFYLQHYTNRKGQLSDYDERVSFGDIIAEHPTERLIISKNREIMFE